MVENKPMHPVIKDTYPRAMNCLSVGSLASPLKPKTGITFPTATVPVRIVVRWLTQRLATVAVAMLRDFGVVI